MINQNMNVDLLSVVGQAELPKTVAAASATDTALDALYSVSTFVCC